jgi:hypothetical protein
MTTQSALSALLLALGFEAMAEEVLTETEHEMLVRYARVIVKNSPESVRPSIIANLSKLKLI